MGIVLFHLQFYRLGMGMLLCFCAETPLGKPRIYVRADAADLWIRSACVLISTIRVRDSIPLIFLFGMVGATLLEYVTGAVMERLFNVKYWDYSNQKFNLNGYICLTSSLGWGLFSVLLVKFVHVPIEGAVLKIPTIIAEGIAFVLTVAAAVDVTQSFNDAMDLKRILAQLEESKKQIRKIQEKLKVASEEFVEDYRQRAGEFCGRLSTARR